MPNFYPIYMFKKDFSGIDSNQLECPGCKQKFDFNPMLEKGCYECILAGIKYHIVCPNCKAHELCECLF